MDTIERSRRITMASVLYLVLKAGTILIDGILWYFG